MLTFEELKTSFGPCGRKKLLIHSGKRIVVTNDLSVLLPHCAAVDPVDKILLDVSLRLGSSLGDHSMTALLLMTATLRHLSAAAETSKLHFATLQRVLGSVELVVKEPMLRGQIASLLCQHGTVISMSAEQWCRAVWCHVLLSSSNSALATTLTDILWQWLGDHSSRPLPAIALKCQLAGKNLARFCLFTDNPGLLQSQRARVLCEEVILEGSFRATALTPLQERVSERPMGEGLGLRRFLCIRYISVAGSESTGVGTDEEPRSRFVGRQMVSLFGADRTAGVGSVTAPDSPPSVPMLISTPIDAPALRNIVTVSVQHLLSLLHAMSVDYLVTCESLPTEALQLLTAARVAVVHRVPADCYDLLCARCCGPGRSFGFDTAQEFINSEAQDAADYAAVDGTDDYVPTVQQAARFGYCAAVQAVRLVPADPHTDPHVLFSRPQCWPPAPSAAPSASAVFDEPPPQLLLFGGRNAAVTGTYNSLLQRCLVSVSTAVADAQSSGVGVNTPPLVCGGGSAEMLWSILWEEVATLLLQGEPSVARTVGGDGSLALLREVAVGVADALLQRHGGQDMHCCHRVVQCISSGYAEVCTQLLSNSLRQYAPPVPGILHHCVRCDRTGGNDEGSYYGRGVSVANADKALLRQVFLRSEQWRGALRRGEPFSLFVDGCVDDGCGPALYPFSAFWTIFISVLGTTRMMVRLGCTAGESVGITTPAGVLRVKGPIIARERERQASMVNQNDFEVN